MYEKNCHYDLRLVGNRNICCLVQPFCGFCQRPLLLLFDGHITHISIPVIKRALDKNMIIVKFPLQMCCNLLTFPVLDLLNERGKDDFINA